MTAVLTSTGTESYPHRLQRQSDQRYAADLEAIKAKGVLRVLTRNNSVSYYVARGWERGFEFELASAFAESLGVRASFVVPERRGDLMQALLAGEGDMIAAGMSLTSARAEKLRFSDPYLMIERVVAVHEDFDQPVSDLQDLLGLPIHVSFRSTTFQDAKALERQLGQQLQLRDVEDGAEMERMMERVVEGQYQATIVDDVLLGLEQMAGLPLKAGTSIGSPRPKAWGFHPASVRLHRAANQFLTNQRRLTAIYRRRYFTPSSKVARSARREPYRADETGEISPFDHLFRKEGAASGIDWRLLAAVSFAESRFDPKAESRFGAKGLMQLLPATAQRVGVTELFNPALNIKAGARYLSRLIAIFKDSGLSQDEQLRFAIASYNCGLGHVFDARELARRTGRNPNQWFGEVEVSMRLKEQPKWHRTTRYGYARARETIGYVAAVQAYFETFSRHVPLR